MRIQGATDTIVLLFWLALLGVGAGGWVANVVKLVGLGADAGLGIFIVRAAGIFVPPLGAVLGFV